MNAGTVLDRTGIFFKSAFSEAAEVLLCLLRRKGKTLFQLLKDYVFRSAFFNMVQDECTDALFHTLFHAEFFPFLQLICK